MVKFRKFRGHLKFYRSLISKVFPFFLLVLVLICISFESAFAEEVDKIKNVIHQEMQKSVDSILTDIGAMSVDDDNYYEAIDTSVPFSVFFYSQKGNASKGMAVVCRLLNENYPDIKWYAYQLTYEDMAVGKRWNAIKTKYNIRTIPTLIVFNVVDGTVEGGVRVGGGESEVNSIAALYENIVNDNNFPNIKRAN